MDASHAHLTETEPPRYALKLLSVGPDRVRLLFEIRAARPDLSLSAAKALLDGVPSLVKSELTRWDVDRLYWRFNMIAQVEIVYTDGRPLEQPLYATMKATSAAGMIDG